MSGAKSKNRAGRWGLAVGASVAAHLGLVLWVSRAPAPERAPPEAESIRLTFEVAPPPKPPADVAPEPPEPRPQDDLRRRRPRRRPAPAPAPAPNPEPGALAPGPAGTGPAEPSGEGPAVAPGDRGGGVLRTEPLDLDVRPRGPPGPQLVLPKAPPKPSGPKLRPQPDGGYVVKDSQFTARIAPDGTITFEDKTALQRWHGTSYEIDVTDMVMRSIGDDPYGHAKRRVLEQTQGLRAKMAERACKDRLRESVVEMKGRLDRIWTDPGRTKAERRRLLFALWDDCVEDGDAERVKTGAMIRETIYAFIQTNLPRGSADAFTPDELAVLNRRRLSTARFSPYSR